MSCINLRLLPAKKAWKSLAYKLQTKLRKLNKSKAIKKPSKHRSNPSYSSTKAIEPPRVFSDKKIRKRVFLHPSRSRNSSIRFRFHFHRKAAPPPVFIDKLFQEPVTAGLVSTKCPSLSAKILDCQATKTTPGTRKKDGNDAERTCPADDMWESVGFASPQMRGIDERAEQFISSFRAEMELQERKARAL